jgi:hypothetical protein
MFGVTNPPKPSAVHLRMPFSISDPETLGYLKLRVQCDDGFVAWLNGTEIASQNSPTPLVWNSSATADASSTVAITFREIDLSQHLGLLRQGDNLLAVQAMNRNPSSPDFLFNCELVSGIDAVNSRWLVLTDLRTSVAGSYSVSVVNPAGSVTSDPVPVLVVPSIADPPLPVRIESGATAQLSVAVDGSPPFSYQWYEGQTGDISNPVAGATLPDFTTPALTATTRYWVRVTSPAGTVNSTTATVTVNAALDPYTAWKASRFSDEEIGDPAISGPPADPDGDGLPNETEYVFGSEPLQAEPAPFLGISVNGNEVELAFTARKAAGPGYESRVRHYTIETAADLTAGPWTPLAEAADITGNDQLVTVVLPQSTGRTFCRLKARLTP